jgi:hypothetical protein
VRYVQNSRFGRRRVSSIDQNNADEMGLTVVKGQKLEDLESCAKVVLACLSL